MRILLTTRWSGGIKTYFRYMYGQKYFRDISFTLITQDNGFWHYLKACGISSNFNYIPVNHGSMNFIKAVRKALKREKFDLLHSHGFTSGVLCETARRGLGIKHLMTAHDVFLPQQFTGSTGSLQQTALGFAFSCIDNIHTVTHDASSNLMTFFPMVKPERIHCILHGVDTNWFALGQRITLKKRLGIENSTPVIGFFGRFMAQKGFRDLVDAMDLLSSKMHPAYMPKVMTFGSGEFINRDYRYLESKGLGEYFIRMPHTDNMPAMLKSVDMVAMPSLWEACGLLAMESLVTGTPLIATNCIGLREVVENTPAKIIPPQSPIALANAIEDYMKHPRKNVFDSFAPEARRRFSAERASRELHELYMRLT